ncbi:unnamed protein product [Chrysoparadoxa australica]
MQRLLGALCAVVASTVSAAAPMRLLGLSLGLGVVHGYTTSSIALGQYTTCSLNASGGVLCWGWGLAPLGYGSYRTIGDNEFPGKAGLISLGTGRTATKLAMGSYHVIAILDDGTVKTWGEGDDGKLGYGNTNHIGDNELPDVVGVVDLGTGVAAKECSGGDHHTCCINNTDSVMCWGKGALGRLGYGNTYDIGDNEAPSTAGTVDLGGRRAKAIACGGDHSCVITDLDTVMCWGAASNGQLGYGNTNDIGDDELPSDAGAVSLGAGVTAKAISAGDGYTCIISNNSLVKCWGSSFSGRLGYGNEEDIGDDETPDAVGFVSLGSGRTAQQISVGRSHNCAVLDDATVRCWGQAISGQLGLGNQDTIGDDELPSSVGVVSLGAGVTAKAVAAGGEHSCIIDNKDELSCWGDAFYGQLGYGNTEDIGDDELPSSVGHIHQGACGDGDACQNGGICDGTAEPNPCSSCDAGYHGSRCELYTDDGIDGCLDAPCLNGGVCTDAFNSFTCSCVASYSGSTCAVLGPTCTSSIETVCAASTILPDELPQAQACGGSGGQCGACTMAGFVVDPTFSWGPLDCVGCSGLPMQPALIYFLTFTYIIQMHQDPPFCWHDPYIICRPRACIRPLEFTSDALLTRPPGCMHRWLCDRGGVWGLHWLLCPSSSSGCLTLCRSTNCIRFMRT